MKDPTRASLLALAKSIYQLILRMNGGATQGALYSAIIYLRNLTNTAGDGSKKAT